MVDIPLQAYGWQRGWASWSAIAANARFVGRGATFVSDEVASGRASLGLTIDFFAASAIANGAPLRFAYPKQGGVNPAHIAITRQAPNLEGARAFAAFVLSETGQKILVHADIRKLPVLPSVYRTLATGYHDPFAAAEAGGYAYDNERGRDRLALVAAAFDAGFVKHHERLATLWRRLAAATSPRRREAQALLEAAPVAEAEAGDRQLQEAFTQRLPQVQAVEQRWAAAAAQRIAAAASLLEAA